MSPEAKHVWSLSLLPQSQRGLSLLEVMIAMAIVFLALLGFAGYSVVAHTGMSASEKMTRAVTLAQEKMEDLRREGIPPGMISPLNTIESYGDIPGAPHHQRILTVTSHDPMPGLHTIIVHVKWDHGAHATSLKTYLVAE